MKKAFIATACISLAFAISSVQAAGDPEKGQEKSATCAACHGADGNTPTVPTYPKLAGQNPEYLVSAIKAYKSGERTGGQAPMMTGMVAPLTDEDIENLAAYFAAQVPTCK